MADTFFEQPILNSPYAYPDRHWELDDEGQPTNIILPKRRDSKLLTPVPKPRLSLAGAALKRVFRFVGL